MEKGNEYIFIQPIGKQQSKRKQATPHYYLRKRKSDPHFLASINELRQKRHCLTVPQLRQRRRMMTHRPFVFISNNYLKMHGFKVKEQ